jgi:hypothetical protein
MKVASEPEALLQALKKPCYHLKRVGLEAGPLSHWLSAQRSSLSVGNGLSPKEFRNQQKETAMPAKSAAQQKAAGAALAAKRGEISPSELKGASKEMYSSMSESQLEEFASTKRKGKPEHVSNARSSSSKSRKKSSASG